MFTPPKKKKKFHDKTVQSNILWLNVIKIGGISILQSAHKQGHPSFHVHAPGSKRRYPCTQTASAVPKYFPCLLQFRTGYHIWHASRVSKQKKRAKNVHFHTTKNIQIQSTHFRYFYTNFSKLTSDLLVWPVAARWLRRRNLSTLKLGWGWCSLIFG